LSADLNRVDGIIRAAIEGTPTGPVIFEISKDGNILIHQKVHADESGESELEFSLDTPKLWYPYLYGSQDLYKVKVCCGAEEFAITSKIGFRKVELVQEEDKVGKSFYFKINNIAIFCGGSNWIPADSFTPRVTPESYRQWLDTLVDGNQSMIR
jgi:beta-mannosidase